MSALNIALGVLAYVVPVMPYAYVWHMVWFKARYEQWQYFDRSASVPLGFSSMIVQGIILSVSYAFLIHIGAKVHPFVFAASVGAYHWTVHVLAAMAKNSATRTWGYLGLETVYLVGQFAVFGELLGLIYGTH